MQEMPLCAPGILFYSLIGADEGSWLTGRALWAWRKWERGSGAIFLFNLLELILVCLLSQRSILLTHPHQNLHVKYFKKLSSPKVDPGVRKVPWRRKWQPTPVILPGESQGQRTWRAAVPGVAKSRTRLTEHARTHLKGVVHFCWHLPDRDLRTCSPVIHVSRRKSRP